MPIYYRQHATTQQQFIQDADKRHGCLSMPSILSYKFHCFYLAPVGYFCHTNAWLYLELGLYVNTASNILQPEISTENPKYYMKHTLDCTVDCEGASVMNGPMSGSLISTACVPPAGWCNWAADCDCCGLNGSRDYIIKQTTIHCNNCKPTDGNSVSDKLYNKQMVQSKLYCEQLSFIFLHMT